MTQPSLRDQQQELTRERIFRALVDVILEEGVHAFTIQRVAERAGISPRTIYRHFPTREALLDQIGEWSVEEQAQAGMGPPASAGDFPDQVRRLFSEWDREEHAVRAFAIMRVTAGLQARERTERVKRVDALLDEWAPHAPQEYRDRARRVIRALNSTITWSQMRSDLGISGAEAGDAVAYAIELVLDDLKRRSGPGDTDDDGDEAAGGDR